MKRRKVCVVITARPSYSRIKTALKAIQEHPDLELQLVVAASALLDRYGSAIRYIADDGFEVAARVYSVLEGENLAAMAKTTGLGLLELATVFDNLSGRYRGERSRSFTNSGYRVPVSTYMGQVRRGSSSYSHTPLLDRASCHTDHHHAVLVHGLGGSHLEAVRALTRVIIASRTMSCRPLPRRCAGTPSSSATACRWSTRPGRGSGPASRPSPTTCPGG